MIDWRSTEPKDLVAVDLLYPKRQEGEDDDDRGKEVLADPASLASMEGYEVRGKYPVFRNMMLLLCFHVTSFFSSQRPGYYGY